MVALEHGASRTGTHQDWSRQSHQRPIAGVSARTNQRCRHLCSRRCTTTRADRFAGGRVAATRRTR